MSDVKTEFTTFMKNWLENYLGQNFSKTHVVQTILPQSNISKLPLPEIKTLDGYASFEFKPDVLGVLTDKKTKQTELVFLNRSMTPASVKEIGELLCYSKIAKPKISILVSLKGLPTEVNLLLLNDSIQKRLLEYDKEKFIVIFRCLEENGKINLISIYPTEKIKY